MWKVNGRFLQFALDSTFGKHLLEFHLELVVFAVRLVFFFEQYEAYVAESCSPCVRCDDCHEFRRDVIEDVVARHVPCVQLGHVVFHLPCFVFAIVGSVDDFQRHVFNECTSVDILQCFVHLW